MLLNKKQYLILTILLMFIITNCSYYEQKDLVEITNKTSQKYDNFLKKYNAYSVKDDFTSVYNSYKIFYKSTAKLDSYINKIKYLDNVKEIKKSYINDYKPQFIEFDKIMTVAKKKINDKELISNIYVLLSKISIEANKYKIAHNKLVDIINKNKDTIF